MITVRGHAKTLEDLKKMSVERPANAGSHWQGIGHYDLARTIGIQLKNRGWRIMGARFATARHGADMAGAYALYREGVPLIDGTAIALGVIHSNARRRALRLYVGATIAVCSNGLATGEIVLRKKHTTGTDLEEELGKALDRFETEANHVGDFIATLMKKKVSNPLAEHLLLEAGRANAMPWSRLGAVDALWRGPRHAEYGTGTAWCLMQCFTEVVKRNPPIKQIGQINTFRELLLNATNN